MIHDHVVNDKPLQEERILSTQRYVGRSQECVGRGYVDAETDVSKIVVRKASSKALSTYEQDEVDKELLPTHS